MSLDSYTLHLLGMAVEEAHRRHEWIDFFPKGWDKAREGDVFTVGMYRSGPVGTDPEKFMRDAWAGETLAEALASLLRDLGVEVPERPTEPGIRLAGDIASLPENGWRYLRELYAREPLTVLCAP